MLTTPTADQIKTLQKKMRARLEAGKQLKEKQDKQGHEIRRRAEESEKQEAEKKERAELAKRKEFEKKSGLDSIKALHPKREKAALKRNFDKELEKLDARRKELEGLGNAARNLGLDHIQVINDARKETEQRISALSSCPAVPYQVIDPKAAINILRTMLDEEREAQISQVTLKYADHRRTLKASGNTGFYDERIALWQVVTKLLVKDTRTAEEESAMDLGLFNLSNDWLADFSDDFHSIKFEGNLSAHILTCMNSEKPEIVSETKAKYPKLDLTYPDAEHWSNIIWNMNQKLSDYKDTKTRQEEDIADAKWAESPQGRAEIARRQAENAAWHARQRQHDLEYEQYLGAQRAERENRERESW
jgi:hypothetical protein